MKFSLLLFFLFSSTVWGQWSVTTYNLRNFDKDSRRGRTDLVELTRIMESYKSDVMAFQEIAAPGNFRKMIERNLPGYKNIMTTCGGAAKQQLALAFNEEVFEFVRRIEDRTFSGGQGTNGCGPLRPVLVVDLLHKKTNTVYSFAIVHLKAGGSRRDFERRWRQYGGLKHLSDRYLSKNLILLGDFNSTGYSIRDEDFLRFEDFISQANMRTVSENLGCTSYWPGNLGGEEYQSSILDHILIQDKNWKEITEVKLGTHCQRLNCQPATKSELGPSFNSVSDHCPIQVTFK